MNSNNTNTEIEQGKQSSFWLLTGENSIVIPIIQRDYAQGRQNNDIRQIRESFVKKMFKVIDSSEDCLDLDFVYGSIEQPKDVVHDSELMNFIPLDGQQRLTTLYILHWYLALWNNTDFELFKSHVSGRFSYKTRTSSNEFCERMIQDIKTEDIKQSIINDTKNPIHSVLQNEGWYHDSWKHDPTNDGMLKMAEHISVVFREFAKLKNIDYSIYAHQLFARLIDKDRPAITFNLLYINKGDFKLSDELYIKMNSRGKPLSDFETFKARFESFARKNKYIDIDAFSKNIDVDWADELWKIRNKITPKNHKEGKYYRDNTDGMMMNIIKSTLANQYALYKEGGMYDEMYESQAAKERNPGLRLSFYQYTEYGMFNDPEESDIDENDKEIDKVFCQSVSDSFQFVYDVLHNDHPFVLPKYLDVKELINEVLFCGIDGANSQISSITYGNRLYFWAICAYHKKHRQQLLDEIKLTRPIDDNTLKDKHYHIHLNNWIHFVRNMVESVDINTATYMQQAISVLNTIFEKMGDVDIIDYLAGCNYNMQTSPFPETQIKEEILKAKLVHANKGWAKLIDKADNVKEWPGRSGYLLFMSGLSDLSYSRYDELETIDHNSYMSKFIAYKKAMDAIIPYATRTNDALLQRALLSKGCYMRKEGNSIIYSLMDQSTEGRSYSIRQMIQYNGIDLNSDDNSYKEGVVTLKEVIDDELFNEKNVELSLNAIINKEKSCIKDWRWPILDNPSLLKESSQRFIWVDNSFAWIPRQKGGNTNHYETWSYHLYHKIKRTEKEDSYLKLQYYPHSYVKCAYYELKIMDYILRIRISHNPEDTWTYNLVTLNNEYATIDCPPELEKITGYISSQPCDKEEDAIERAQKICQDSTIKQSLLLNHLITDDTTRSDTSTALGEKV